MLNYYRVCINHWLVSYRTYRYIISLLPVYHYSTGWVKQIIIEHNSSRVLFWNHSELFDGTLTNEFTAQIREWQRLCIRCTNKPSNVIFKGIIFLLMAGSLKSYKYRSSWKVSYRLFQKLTRTLFSVLSPLVSNRTTFLNKIFTLFPTDDLILSGKYIVFLCE